MTTATALMAAAAIAFARLQYRLAPVIIATYDPRRGLPG
jgi:hypothetical protein